MNQGRASIWIRTDEVTDAIINLKHALFFASYLQEDSYMWKWFILALHSSVQGFMVSALRGTNGLTPHNSHPRPSIRPNGNNAPDNEASVENKGLQPLVLECVDGAYFVTIYQDDRIGRPYDEFNK